mgnify:CR=1 FL=1
MPSLLELSQSAIRTNRVIFCDEVCLTASDMT